MNLVETTPELTFAIEGAELLEYAAVPTICFRLRIESTEARPVSAVALNAQLRIANRKRSYSAATRARLTELLGAPGPDGATIRSLFWTHATLMVPPFVGGVTVDLTVGCTYDFEVAVAKYFHALEEGEVPLEFLFSGSIFYPEAGGALRVGQIPWDREANFRLPIRVWREAMEHHFPRSAWLRLPLETFDRLHAYRMSRLLPRWEDAIDELLAGVVDPEAAVGLTPEQLRNGPPRTHGAPAAEVVVGSAELGSGPGLEEGQVQSQSQGQGQMREFAVRPRSESANP